jgi:NADP-dependent aldehyde dehydrogenase
MESTNDITGMIEQVMQQSRAAFEAYQLIPIEKKALFLESIAHHLEALGDELLQTTATETNLPLPRLTGERGRTTLQLRMFASMLREGSWVEASIDTVQPDKIPAKPDIRKILYPLGPVVVFGASNFPYAYSTAGGDTASALAAGCSVVVKAHPAHLQTSKLVAAAIQKAIAETNMPLHLFQHVTDGSFETGKQLVQHSLTAAVGFTGSFSGGKALYDYAAARKTPIPVFAEMGSINPVLLLPDTLSQNTISLATQYAASITLGMGQFCTNPGLLIGIDSPALHDFIDQLQQKIQETAPPAKMLHAGIANAYATKLQAALNEKGVVAKTTIPSTNLEAGPAFAVVSSEDFIQQPFLKEEVFGPYSLLVICKNKQEMLHVWQSVKGQLTTSLMGTEKDFTDFPELLQIAPDMAGRIVFNGVPTGVEVCASMVHSGPFPACTDSRFTAVGIGAVKRWVRPVSYQGCFENLLPLALQSANPLGIWRMVNNEWTKEKLL